MKSRVTFLFSAFTFLAAASGFSQTALRSIASGNWTAFATTWERTGNIYNPTPTWAAATAAPTTNQIAIIRSGHVVTIDQSGRNTKTIIVEAGGQLFAGGAANSVRVGVPATGTAGSVDTLTVDGMFGGPSEVFPLEFGVGAASVWIRGAGTVEIGRIRPVNGNLNFPGSVSPNAATGFRLLVDKDIKLNTSNNSVFSVTNTSPSANDSISYTILAGRTVTIASSSSYFHNNNVTDGVVSAGGNYEYRIDGTLDLSANLSTLGGNSLIPYATATSGLTLNVNGLLKLGGYFKADTVSNSLGALNLNINNGGLVDATLTSKLITGTIGAATATPNIFFKISGTGALRRTVPADGTKTEFNIGTSLTSYTPLTINGVGPAEVYTVTLKNTFTNPAPATSLAKEWNITEATAGGNATDTLRFEWTIADQTNGFTGLSPVFVRRWNGTAWDETLASVSGDGSAANPYVAKAAGFNAFGLFILSNTGTTPVAFVNEKAYQKQNGVQVEFGNATESDILNYVVEKSADGNKFTPVNTISPKANNGGFNSYAYFDATPNNGLNFYRIKATEKNGTVKYSNTLNIRLQTNGIWVNAYPNPVKGGNVNVQLENFDKSIYNITVTNQVGQIVYVKNINHNGGTATFKLDLPASVKKGIYSLQVSNTVTRVINKIVVE
jgi:hypothetical protein